MHRYQLFALLCFGLLLSGCGETRRNGDPDGIPVSFNVHAESAFFSRMADHRTSVSSGLGLGFGSGGGIGSGVGIGIGYHGTTAYLLGGAHPGEAGSFRHELKWGDTTFSVPLRTGRTVVLTAQAQGGREGWETVGEFTVTAGAAQTITVVLDANGAKLTVQ